MVTRRGNPSSFTFMQPIVLEGGKVAAAEITTVETTPCPANSVATILSIAARDVDNAISTLIEIGILDGVRKILIDSTPGNFPANTSMTIYWPCVLREGQKLYAVFATPSAGDHLEVVAHGYVEKCEERVSVFRQDEFMIVSLDSPSGRDGYMPFGNRPDDQFMQRGNLNEERQRR